MSKVAIITRGGEYLDFCASPEVEVQVYDLESEEAPPEMAEDVVKEYRGDLE